MMSNIVLLLWITTHNNLNKKINLIFFYNLNKNDKNCLIEGVKLRENIQRKKVYSLYILVSVSIEV